MAMHLAITRFDEEGPKAGTEISIAVDGSRFLYGHVYDAGGSLFADRLGYVVNLSSEELRSVAAALLRRWPETEQSTTDDYRSPLCSACGSVGCPACNDDEETDR